MKDAYIRLSQLASSLYDSGAVQMAEMIWDKLDGVWFALTPAERRELDGGVVLLQRSTR